jgi:hypothetical protein
MKYGVEIGSGAMKYVHIKFHKDWLRHSKVNIGRIHRHTDSMEIAEAYSGKRTTTESYRNRS